MLYINEKANSRAQLSRSLNYRFTFLCLSFQHLLPNKQIVTVLWISTHQTLLRGKTQRFKVSSWFLKIMKLIKYQIAQKCHNFQQCCIWLHYHWLWSHLGFFYHSKVEFTTVNTFSNVTGFSHFTMVNTDLVCCGGNGGRMKAKFTIVNFPKTIWFIAGISKLCLFSWHLVALFEMRSLSVTLLNTYTCIFSAASLFFSFFRAKQYSRDVTVTQTIFAFIRGKSTVNSGFQGIIRLHLMFVFHFWVEHKFRSKSFNSSVFYSV